MKKEVVGFAIVKRVTVNTIVIDDAVLNHRVFFKAFKASLNYTYLIPAFITRVKLPVGYVRINRFSYSVFYGLEFRPVAFVILRKNINVEITALIGGDKFLPFL